ncbi:hypothetical protein F4818DRAFT_455777 [Hypoxylon cercidicola]|nr:hypothetical protein F4818DRAFT_455777 [Hypoxylon cercidicola]
MARYVFERWIAHNFPDRSKYVDRLFDDFWDRAMGLEVPEDGTQVRKSHYNNNVWEELKPFVAKQTERDRHLPWLRREGFGVLPRELEKALEKAGLIWLLQPKNAATVPDFWQGKLQDAHLVEWEEPTPNDPVVADGQILSVLDGIQGTLDKFKDEVSDDFDFVSQQVQDLKATVTDWTKHMTRMERDLVKLRGYVEALTQVFHG